MNFIKEIDDRLLQWTQKWYMDLYGKPKILSLAVLLLTSGLLIEKSPKHFLWWIYLCLFMFSIFIFIYEKRVWYRLRRKGVREAEGLFFEDSAHPLRRWAFLLACIFLLSRRMFLPNYSIHSFIQSYGLSKHIVFSFIYMMFFSLYLIELLRFIVPSGASWSNRKHFYTFLVVYGLSLSLTFVGLYILGFPGSVV